MFIPENEPGVFYLFSKLHKELGFEEIIKINRDKTPDIVALRNGMPVNIELEFDLGGLSVHYVYGGFRAGWHWDSKYSVYIRGRLLPQNETELNSFIENVDKKQIQYYSHDANNWWAAVSDPNNMLYLKRGNLMRKTLKPEIECVVCWKRGVKRIIKDDIEIITLNDKLIQNSLIT